MAEDDDKFLAEMESKLKLGEDEEEKLDFKEMTDEEKEKLSRANLDEDLLRGKDGQVHHIDEIEFIIKDVLKHQDKAFKYEKSEPKRETIDDVELKPGQKNEILKEHDFVRHDTAALAYTDQELLVEQRRVIIYLAKKIGVNILTGKSIMNVSLPIKIFEARSFLEKIAKDFAYAPYFLD